MKISVALAAYNGEKYIGEQIESILPQLGRDDEIVVSDDNPAGKTRAAVEFYSAYDGRVRYVEGTGEGVCRNFENAILNCSGDVIFLCDQDDVWLPNKVERVMEAIENGADVVLHDAMMTDGELNVTDESFFSLNGSKKGICQKLSEEFIHGLLHGVQARFRACVYAVPQRSRHA